jgi:hypothetical protein
MNFHNITDNNYVLYEGTILSYIFFSILLFIVCLCNINCFYMYRNMIKKSIREREASISATVSLLEPSEGSEGSESSDSSSNKISIHPPSYNSINYNSTDNNTNIISV